MPQSASFQTSSQDSSCACRHGGPGPMAEDAAGDTRAWLGAADAAYGEQLHGALISGAHGQGPLAGRVHSLGVGARALEQAQPGDLLVSVGLFPESDPRIDVVGDIAASDHRDLIEAETGHADLEVLRLAENPAASMLGGMLTSKGVDGLVSGTGSGIGNAIGTLITDPTIATRNRIKTANAAIDLAQRVGRIASAFRGSFSGLRFTASGLSYASGYTPVNAPTKTNVWRFELRCKHERGGRSYATYPLQVVVNHDCFNIFDAQVIPMSPTINGYLSHQLTLNVTPMSTTMGNSIPPVVRFRVAGVWDPADFMGRVKESFLGYIVIRSDGMVRIQNMRSDMVSPTDLIPVSGPSVGGCEPLFRRFRRAASAPALPQSMGGGAASPRP
ncbi:MAG: hypothetical protein AAGF20_05325, partial [Pseudomonadota bacterium]